MFVFQEHDKEQRIADLKTEYQEKVTSMTRKSDSDDEDEGKDV